MTINYKGLSKDFDYRIAEISYDESEYEVIDRMVFFLNRIKGWEMENPVMCYAYCAVDSKAQYEEFKRDYLVAKRMIKNCIKYGF